MRNFLAHAVAMIDLLLRDLDQWMNRLPLSLQRQWEQQFNGAAGASSVRYCVAMTLDEICVHVCDVETRASEAVNHTAP
jgi:hypothetical protein